MKCPNCGKPGVTRPIRRCRSCGEGYATEDLLRLHQLEFLLAQTAGWEGTKAVREPYAVLLKELRARLVPPKPIKPEGVAPEPIPESAVAKEVAAPVLEPAPARAIAVPAAEPAVVKPETAPSPPKEKVPFDQWLLSERNIKIALYSGAVMLVVAGLIFVSVSWGRMSGPAKFAIMVLITGLMYLGGYLLFQRPSFRIGGIALLGVASGFVIVNFAILQLFVLGPAGLRDDVMWLIASVLCLVLYLLTAYWTRGDLFTYISLAAVVSIVTAALVVADAPLLVYLPAYALLAYGLMWLARATHGTGLADFTFLPLLIVSQAGMAALVLAAFASPSMAAGSIWLSILALSIAVVFYLTTDALFEWLAAQRTTGIPQPMTDAIVKWRPARWVAAVLLPVILTLALMELNASDTVLGLALMVLALAHQGIGYILERREKRRIGAWPFYATAYAVALLVTLMALPEADGLYKVLFGDVVLVAVSAAIFRDYRWIYGAAWLFMLPVYLFLTLYVPSLVYRGLFMGLLGLNYAIAGYALGRRSLFLGGPFLTAAAFLSVVTIGLTWGNPVMASLVLGVVVVLYLGAALWLGWHWLLLAPLLAVHLLIFTLNQMLVPGAKALAWALTVSYGVLGLVLILGGLALRRLGQVRWGWPLYLVCVLDLVGSYLAGLALGGPLAVGVSAMMAVLLFSFAWLERAELLKHRLPPVLTYAGIAAVFVGHFYVLNLFGLGVVDVWPPFTAGLCALFVFLAWLLRREQWAGLYGVPLRWAGLALMAVPVVASMAFSPFGTGPVTAVLTLAIAGLTYGADGTLRRVPWLAWLTVAVVFVGHFFLLGAVGIGFEGPWPIVTSGLCAAFVFLTWLLRRGWPAPDKLRGVGDLYSTPLRWAGLALMVIPMMGSVALAIFGPGPIGAVITWAIAGLTYGADRVLRRAPWLAWLTIAVVFVWHFFVQAAVGIRLEGIWPIVTAGLCAAFVALAWLLRGHGSVPDRPQGFDGLYEVPLRWAGLALMLIPLMGAVWLLLVTGDAVLLSVTFAIAGLTFEAEGAIRRVLWLVYVGVATFVVVIWGILMALNVSEPQAYIFPLGLMLLGISSNERRHRHGLQYQGCSVTGMVVLMGSAFIQSLGPDNWPYAMLLVVESVAAIAWGARRHLKRYVQVGGVALLANGIAQLGPAFVELSGWIQIGLTGTILLGGGMLALLKREEILAARHRFSTEWRNWEP